MEPATAPSARDRLLERTAKVRQKARTSRNREEGIYRPGLAEVLDFDPSKRESKTSRRSVGPREEGRSLPAVEDVRDWWNE